MTETSNRTALLKEALSISHSDLLGENQRAHATKDGGGATTAIFSNLRVYLYNV